MGDKSLHSVDSFMITELKIAPAINKQQVVYLPSSSLTVHRNFLINRSLFTKVESLLCDGRVRIENCRVAVKIMINTITAVFKRITCGLG